MPASEAPLKAAWRRGWAHCRGRALQPPRANEAAVSLAGTAPQHRHLTDKQQKNAILNDAGVIGTLRAIERRVCRRHGEGY